MRGLEIVMNIDTLEVYEVIDHDKENQSEKLPLEDSVKFLQVPFNLIYLKA